MPLPTRTAAHTLLNEHVTDEYQRHHAEMVAVAVEGYATLYNEDSDLWYLTGLLHDLDFDGAILKSSSTPSKRMRTITTDLPLFLQPSLRRH